MSASSQTANPAAHRAGSAQPLRCWAVSDGRRGMENQALGLAEALGRRRALDITIKRVSLAPPYRWLPYPALGALPLDPAAVLDRDSDPVAPPWPDVLIGCGRQSVAVSLAVRRLSAGHTLTVQTQDPRIAPACFDLVFPALHDGLTGANVTPLLGAPHRVDGPRLAAEGTRLAGLFRDLPRPLACVLIGGDSRHLKLAPPQFEAILEALKALARSGHGLAVSASRRTRPAQAARLRTELEPLGAYVWNGEGDNPYFAMLAAADHILVTAESINMLTEAAATGKPVHVLPLKGHAAKFDRFHADLRARGIARPFSGRLETWNYTPLAETDRAAGIIEAALAARARGRSAAPDHHHQSRRPTSRG
ncbi:MAG: mitochondrial fission ELM1 family protein [Alphaproteobacteria bacterium]